MARDRENRKGRIRFVLVEVESDDETLQETLRTVANALSRQQVLPAKATTNLPNGKGARGKAAEETEDVTDVQSAMFEDVETTEDEAETGKAKSARRIITPKVLNDVEFTSGNAPLREFAAGKRVENHFDRYLVIAVWFKEHRGVDTITPNHVYTAYRFMSWSMPKDWGQVFRDMKKHKGDFDNGEARNSWKVTHIGEDKVRQMANQD